MANAIINYTFESNNVANPNGSNPANFSGTTVVTGPGNTYIGEFEKAIFFGQSGKARVSLSGATPNLNQFCFQFLFKIQGTVNERQNLFESTLLPFSISVNPGANASSFIIKSSLGTANHGWSGPDSMYKASLRTNNWYFGTVAFDSDTVGLIIQDISGNEKLVSIHGFPNGNLNRGNGNELFVGTWVNGSRNQFHGSMAMFKWYNGIPENIESRLDELRLQPEWYVSYKYESFRKNFRTGNKTKGLEYNNITGSHTQYYENCAIMFHSGLGVAYEIHGNIFNKYKSIRNKSVLGYLVTDEIDTSKASGKKSLFQKGGIYWSGSTGAIPVLGQIFVDYEDMGESSSIGFPTKEAKSITEGFEQEFQISRMYHKAGEVKAFEVRGSILQKFLSTGGVNKWGYPIVDESDVNNGVRTIGKFSEFEKCTIYWSSRTGAYEVHGSIRENYEEIIGPLGELGFPTSDEVNIPGVSGEAKANTFQNGSILWFRDEGTFIAFPFKMRIGRIDSKESEGFGMGENDLYFEHIRVKEGNNFLYNSRYPRSGIWKDSNVKDVNFTMPFVIMPNNLNKKVSFSVKIMDEDPWSNDHLGSYSTILNAANVWGLRENNGSHNIRNFTEIKSFTWSVLPQRNLENLTELQKWWGPINIGTPEISKNKYAKAFRDVDESVNLFNPILLSYYNLVIKGIAKNGNCFGMSLEGIYARKNNSIFGMPLKEYKWPALEEEFNIKQCYQAGASAVWWFVGQFLSGSTHSPKHVSEKTRSYHSRGNHPIICISQNYWFTGAHHAILPVDWNPRT